MKRVFLLLALFGTLLSCGQEQGPKGDKGDQGVQGIQGPQGVQGIPGPTGPRGIPGPRGLKGEKGDPGIGTGTGTIGPEGPEGPEGPIGPQGIAGPQGPMGPQGPQGDIGPAGYSFRGAFVKKITRFTNNCDGSGSTDVTSGGVEVGVYYDENSNNEYDEGIDTFVEVHRLCYGMRVAEALSMGYELDDYFDIDIDVSEGNGACPTAPKAMSVKVVIDGIDLISFAICPNPQ